MKDTATETVRYGYGGWVQIIGLLAFVGLSCGFYFGGISGWPAVIWFSFAAIGTLYCLCVGKTIFRCSERRIIYEWKFLGLLPFWRREYTFDLFNAVERRRQKGSEDDIITVGLTSPTRRPLVMQIFQTSTGQVCPEAAALCSRISELTGLPISAES